MFGLKMILTIIVVSGAIAFIGDRVGHNIGKKRLSIFNMRPRHTAIAITIVTGALIAIFTGSILFMSSSDVRTAFFGLDRLRTLIKQNSAELEKLKTDRIALEGEVKGLEQKLSDSKQEISSLNNTKENLSKQVSSARSGLLLLRINDVITSAVLDPMENKDLIEAKLTKILSETDQLMRQLSQSKNKHLVVMNNDELLEAVDYISEHKSGTIVRVVAASNVVLGEDIPVHFELFSNQIIYNRGENIFSGQVDGRGTTAQVEQSIKDLLSQVNDAAIKKGLVPDTSGSVGVIPYSKIFDAVKTIKARNKTVMVSVETAKDIYSSGPLEITIKVSK